MTWRGWPAKGTTARAYLDTLYWGDDPRTPEENGEFFYPPLVASDTAISPIALFREAHDGRDRSGEAVRDFLRGWRLWRAHGASLEERKRKSYRVLNPDDFIRPSITTWTRGRG